MSSTTRPSQRCNTLRSHRWPRMRMLDDVTALNEHLLESLGATLSVDGTLRHLLAGEAAALAGMELAARRRAARVPVLLMDLNFCDGSWWRSAACCDEDDLGESGASWQQQLAREVLTVTWSAIREDRAAASLLVGISRPVSLQIETLNPRQLDRIGARHGAALRPRWQHVPSFWQRLFSASVTADEAALSSVQVQALQLLAAELFAASDVRHHADRPARTAPARHALSHASS